MEKLDIVFYPNFEEILYKIIATKGDVLTKFGPYNETIKPNGENDCVLMRVTNVEVKNGTKFYEAKGERIQEKFNNLRKLEI